jgi:hypothetical protein
MNIDFTILPGWMQTTLLWAAILTVFLTFVAAVTGFVKKVWPALKLFITTVDSLNDLPRFMVTTAASLAAQDTKIAEIHHEVNYNDESSVKDAVARVELGVKGIYQRLDTADSVAAALRRDLEVTRPKPIRKRTPKDTP